MDGIQRTVHLLRGSEDPQAWAAMRAGIAEGDPRVQAAVIETLLTYRDKETPRLVIQHLDRLGEPALAILRKEGADPLRSFIRSSLGELDGKMRENAMHFMSLTGSADTLDMLLLGLDSSSEEERRRSAESMLEAVRKYADELELEEEKLSERRVRNRRKAQVLRCLERALDLYPVHRQRVIFDAVLALGSHGYPLLNQVLLKTARRARPRKPQPPGPEAALPGEPSPEPPAEEAQQVDPRRALILEEMGQRTDPGAMEFLVQLATDAELSKVADQIVDLRQENEAFTRAIGLAVAELELKQFNFLLARCGGYPWTDWVVALAPELDQHQALNAVRFVLRGANPVQQKGHWLEALFQNPSDRVRMHVLNQFEALDPEQGWRILVRALHDRDHPEIQLQAIDMGVEHRAQAPIPIAKLLQPLLTGGDDPVSRRVAAALAKLGLEGYMQAYYKMSPATRDRAAKVLAKLQPRVRETALSELAELPGDQKVACLEFLKTLGEEREAAGQMQALMRDPDHRVRATAVNILGTYGTVESIKLLINALQDPDRRVRANVIEALERVPSPERVTKLLLPYLEHPDNRIRGNAVKALWNLGYRDVLDVVEGMLRHPETNMRLTGLWLIGELGLAAFVPRLKGMAAKDAEPKVREKCEAVLAGLLGKGR